jgi:DNA-binding Lrp family transcriptional regulator
MSEAFSVVGTDDHVHDLFCRSDRCPLVELHRRHDVNIAIDRYVLGAIATSTVIQLNDLREQTGNISIPEVLKALKRLVHRGILKPICPENDLAQLPVAYYRNDGALSNVTWSPTALTVRTQSQPSKLNALDESIVRKIGRYVLKVFWQIYRDVRHDYGSVADRTVYRRLRFLVDGGHIDRISLPMINDGGYVLPGSPLLQDMPTAYEQIRVAHLERRSI